jgi:hypothetical protein
MKAKELIEILQINPEAEVLVRLDGSIYPTDGLLEHKAYNKEIDNEVFVLALEENEHE